MERQRRTHIHKGKARFKRRIPRKAKKAKKQKWDKEWNDYIERLINIYGKDEYYKHVVVLCGG